MKFSLGQLEALLWVVRLGSFRSAATQLNLTQPAISVRVRELESAVGGKLFLRDSYRAKPTPLGREIAAHAERVIAACEELDGRFAADDELRGPVRIGAADTFAMTCLPELMRRIEKRFPKVRTEIRVDFSVLLNSLERSSSIARTPGSPLNRVHMGNGITGPASPAHVTTRSCATARGPSQSTSPVRISSLSGE